MLLIEFLSQVTASPAKMRGSDIIGLNEYRHETGSRREGTLPTAAALAPKPNLVVFALKGRAAPHHELADLIRLQMGKLVPNAWSKHNLRG